MLGQYGDAAAYFQHMAVGSNECVDGVAVEVVQISQINHDIAHVAVDHEANRVLQFGGVENFGVSNTDTYDIKNPNISNIDFDKKPPIKPG